MKYCSAIALLALSACNPAAVAPAPAANQAEAPAVPSATRGTAEAPDDAEPGFAATGQVRCVTRARWAVRDCAAGVMRERDGSSVVTVFHPEGRSRDILFDSRGRATGVRTAEADGSDRQHFSAARSAGLTIVRLGPERYEIPDSLIQRD